MIWSVFRNMAPTGARMNSAKPQPLISRIALTVSVVILLSGLLLAAGCASNAAADSQKTTVSSTSIGEIANNPAVFDGKEVAVKGKITSECGSGCWFNLDDGTGVIYVTLSENNFAIPQLQGQTVLVKGVIHIANGDPSLHGSAVVTDSRTYP